MSLKRVLVCDDEPYILESVSYVVKKLGYGLEVAEDGAEALQRIRAYRPDLVLLDIRMPKMSGHEVCTALRADPETRDCYVIMLSAFGQQSDRETAMASGADEFLTKPFSPRQFKDKLQKLLGPAEAVA